MTAPAVYASSAVATAPDTTPVPPTTMMRPGRRRWSSALTIAGSDPGFVRRSGPPARAAWGTAARASGHPLPLATYAVGTPGAKVAAETAAAVAYRSAPARRE